MDLANSLNWNLIKRESYTAQIISQDSEGYKFLALRDIQLPVRSPVLMVGIRSTKAQPYWITGGWASQLIFVLPSSTTEFTAAVRVGYAQRCQLGILNLIQFPYAGVSPFILNLSFPYWLEDVSIEVWQYGEAFDGTYEPPNTELYKVAEAINRIETKLDEHRESR